MEALAAQADGVSVKYMVVKYMEDHKDQEFLGVVSGVTEWGIYVEIIENKCEGMVRIREIKDDYYSHFTSPIRRYPDVMAHRLLQYYIDGGKSVSEEEYEEKCQHSSQMEALAAQAERDSVKYMQVKYMQDHKDEEFLGVDKGVTQIIN